MQYKWIYNKKLPCPILLPIIDLSYLLCHYIENVLGLIDETIALHNISTFLYKKTIHFTSNSNS